MSDGPRITFQEIEANRLRHEGRKEMLREILSNDFSPGGIYRRAMLAGCLRGILPVKQRRVAELIGISEGRLSQMLKFLRDESQ